MKKLRRIFVMLLCLVMMAGMTASAETPYKTYTIDGYGYVLETQSAYNPLAAITKVGETAFVSPMDMAIGKEGNLYIADAGAHVILICSREGEQVGGGQQHNDLAADGVDERVDGLAERLTGARGDDAEAREREVRADDAQRCLADGERFVRGREQAQQRAGDEFEERAADAHDADG